MMMMMMMIVDVRTDKATSYDVGNVTLVTRTPTHVPDTATIIDYKINDQMNTAGYKRLKVSTFIYCHLQENYKKNVPLLFLR